MKVYLFQTRAQVTVALEGGTVRETQRGTELAEGVSGEADLGELGGQGAVQGQEVEGTTQARKGKSSGTIMGILEIM